jgi:hypothetical protein
MTDRLLRLNFQQSIFLFLDLNPFICEWIHDYSGNE